VKSINKTTTAKTTSQIVFRTHFPGDKNFIEAKREWSVSEISFSLGIFVACCLAFVILSGLFLELCLN